MGVLFWLSKGLLYVLTLVAENEGKLPSQPHSYEFVSIQMKIRSTPMNKVVICRDRDYSRIMTFDIANV